MNCMEDKTMAVKSFDCNKIKRSFWPFTMKDEIDENGKITQKGKTILVQMPTKKVFEKLTEINDVSTSGSDADMDEVYGILHTILANNKGKVRIDRETVEDLDLEECMEIITAYMEFIDTLKLDPN